MNNTALQIIPLPAPSKSTRAQDVFFTRCDELAELCLSIDLGSSGDLFDLLDQLRLVCLSGARYKLAERKEGRK